MSRFFLVRHGRTAHNAARRIQGTLIDESLDDVGRAQADALGARFAELAAEGERFGGVYASPLKRAVETAAPVARALDLKVEPIPGLEEFSWGEFMGQITEGTVREATHQMVERWLAGDLDVAAPGGESPRAAAQRATAALKDVLDRHPRESFVVVAHGRLNKIVLAHLLHRDLVRMEDFPQSNTGVTVLERATGHPELEWRLTLLNDRSHLPESERDGPTSE